jgi:hypothetical protein
VNSARLNAVSESLIGVILSYCHRSALCWQPASVTNVDA